MPTYCLLQAITHAKDLQNWSHAKGLQNYTRERPPELDASATDLLVRAEEAGEVGLDDLAEVPARELVVPVGVPRVRQVLLPVRA